MELLIVYLLGYVVAFSIYLYDIYKEGLITVGQLKALLFVSIFSWIAVVLFVFQHFEDDGVIWRKKK